jgi:hypothetical protein
VAWQKYIYLYASKLILMNSSFVLFHNSIAGFPNAPFPTKKLHDLLKWHCYRSIFPLCKVKPFSDFYTLVYLIDLKK